MPPAFRPNSTKVNPVWRRATQSTRSPFRFDIQRPRVGYPVFPLNPLPVCHVLRPRRNVRAKPFRRFGVARSYRNEMSFRNAVISGFNSMALKLAVYASCQRYR